MRCSLSLSLLPLFALAAAGCRSSQAPPSDDAAPPSAALPATGLTRHDVSVLFPNPQVPSEEALLWRASTPALGGPLLPAEEFARNRRSLSKDVDDALEYESLRVVAVRFDPCFQTTLGGPCQPQIRLVLQPRDPTGGFFDGAVHALYALAPASWSAVRAELERLSPLAPEASPDAPLGVHPTLAARGLDSDYAKALKALVTTHAGPDTLVRVTFMTRTHARSGQWEFSGFHAGAARDGGKRDRLEIAGLGGLTMQNVTRELAPHTYRYTVHPKFADPLGHPGHSAEALAALSPAARAEVHAWARRQEDPSTHLPDTTDCASCHLANRVGRHLEGLDPSLPTAASPRALSPAETDHDNLRAFGWFGNHPAISQRTANETEAVLAALRAAPTPR